MANANGDAWDIASPVGATEAVGAGANEIRVLREGVGTRMSKEHVTLAASGVGGEHKLGSAIAYIGDYSSAYPVNRPDGETLTAADLGRLAYNTDDGKTKILTNHTGPVWTEIPTYNPVAFGDGEESVTFPNGMIMKMGIIATGATTGTLTYGDSFTGVTSVILSVEDAAAEYPDFASITAYDTDGFDWIVQAVATDIHWLAIGW